MTSLYPAHSAFAHKDLLGEGPAWDAANQRLLWVDIFGGDIHRAVSDGADGWSYDGTWQIGEPVSVVIPNSAGDLLVGINTELSFMAEDGSRTRFAAVETGVPGARFNDGKADPRGRLVVGWMADVDDQISGALCSVDADATVTTLLPEVGLPNGLDWSPDGRTFYFIDTLENGLDAFDYDLDTGTISNRRRLITGVHGEGGLDGMTVDSDGNLWIAVLWSGEIKKYTADGVQIGAAVAPTRQVTSCAFGGADLSTLFITSLSVTLPQRLREGAGISVEIAAEVGEDPTTGGLFVARPGVTGRAAYPFGA